ncbi:uncharacterized protein EV422DRAFT_520953 [Fimicolochytrium jonesii]|uniref:uncharacterized protein n=1 Tax=Fimicolochytrium jonesii TaxID=1396493 RepID=UPI0022FDE0D9|nr:uncharacterized protein EV422DRAFT_520953 [Fimicolochytrium jonesii]KAI8823417.1 hypothetical protein EV422DRAFT_520953 [Fimicolochytrium jonesii]
MERCIKNISAESLSESVDDTTLFRARAGSFHHIGLLGSPILLSPQESDLSDDDFQAPSSQAAGELPGDFAMSPANVLSSDSLPSSRPSETSSETLSCANIFTTSEKGSLFAAPKNMTSYAARPNDIGTRPAGIDSQESLEDQLEDRIETHTTSASTMDGLARKSSKSTESSKQASQRSSASGANVQSEFSKGKAGRRNSQVLHRLRQILRI